MQITEQNVGATALYTAPVLAGFMGLCYLLGGAERTSAPSFLAAKSIAPIHAWGWIFLVGALSMGIAAFTLRLELVAITYFVGGTIYAWWGSCFGFQAVQDPRGSLVAPGLYAVICLLHYVAAARAWQRRA